MTYLNISFIVVVESSPDSVTRHTLTKPSLEADASMFELDGEKCTDHTIRLCAESVAAHNSYFVLSSLIPLLQMHILRSFPDDACANISVD
jgi:hypothetical protein